MLRTRLVFAIALSFGSTGIAFGQSSPPAALSPVQRTHLQGERFDLVTSIRGLPLGVRDDMTKRFGGALDIAEPGAEFQVTDVVVKRLPVRRMVAAGCSKDFHCLVYYERGGIAHTWHVMLYQWTPDESRLEWGGAAPGGLSTIDDVRKAILSGAVKAQSGSW